ncbi:MAG: hypothetical protein EOO04_35640 [Chitinophagaceae bacterium]|nr:MAG: hypothetical protein EOO04_35640 [Chitinophagaceae bacterium]
MKLILIVVAAILLITPGCNSDERQQALEQKEAELNRREQDLQLKNQALDLKEEELNRREKAIDSMTPLNVADTLALLHPDLAGVYNVTMRCTQTNCPESAVGDIKNERWHFSIDSNRVVARAMSANQLVRLYTGTYTGTTIQLIAQADTISNLQAGNMIVRLQETKKNQLTGQREITRQDNCRIIYDLELQKQ